MIFPLQTPEKPTPNEKSTWQTHRRLQPIPNRLNPAAPVCIPVLELAGAFHFTSFMWHYLKIRDKKQILILYMEARSHQLSDPSHRTCDNHQMLSIGNPCYDILMENFRQIRTNIFFWPSARFGRRQGAIVFIWIDVSEWIDWLTSILTSDELGNEFGQRLSQFLSS